MNDNPFEIKEEACASSPDHRRYLLIQAVDTETGEIVWAVGDDQICAVTRADFIRTPEIRYGKGEEKETDFFDVVAWRSTAEFICKYFTKGRMISVDGRLQTRGWKDREGNNRVSIEILVDNAYFADSKKDDAAGDFPADDQFAGYGAYQGSVPGGGDDFAPDF